MSVNQMLQDHLSVSCPYIHSRRLQAVIDVAIGLQKSGNLSLTAIGRKLPGESSIKHRIKKADRLLSNRNLYNEVNGIYESLSSYVLKFVGQTQDIPIVIDLCYMKDKNSVQMLSAELALKGRSLPLYRDVFEVNQLKNRASQFIKNLSSCIPADKEVLVIMDAGFGGDWYEAIAAQKWYWLSRIRGKKAIKLSSNDDWGKVSSFYDTATPRAKHYNEAYIIRKSPIKCRAVIKSSSADKRRSYKPIGGRCLRLYKEPWVLVSNLPESYTAAKIIQAYKKRMQIEESFRDVKSHQFGLSARYIRTVSIYRWSIAMLLAAIVQITLWLIGVVGHHQGMQRYFQSNTVKNKKVFSYFYLGQLIVEHDQLNKVMERCIDLHKIVEKELKRDW